MSKLPVVVLISGSGSNLQALIDRSQMDVPIAIKSVISNVDGVLGLERAQKAGVPTAVLDHRAFTSRQAFDQALMTLIDSFAPALVILAGFMRILTPEFTRHYQGRMFNIHPSLLPRHQGLHTHQRALESGDEEHGASVHFVTEELDGGPVILQARVPVLAEDSPQKLADRVLEKEHLIYPLAVKWFAENRLKLESGQILFDGAKLEAPVQLHNLAS